MDAHFGLFGDRVNIEARLAYDFCRTCNRLRNRFGCTRWNTYVMCVKRKLVSIHLETVDDNLDA
jgi:hypothetical protein